MKILLEAVGDFSYSTLGSQFVLDGQTFNYVKKTNFYVNSKYESLYKESGYDNAALIGGDPYAYKYAGDESGKEFFAKQSELPL